MLTEEHMGASLDVLQDDALLVALHVVNATFD